MATQDTLMQAIAQAVNDQTTVLQYMFPGPAMSALITFKASSASSIPMVLINPVRRGLIIVNTDGNDLWIRYGPTATTGSGGWTYKIGAGVTWEMPMPVFAGQIDGIWTAAGTGVAEITEL